MGGRPLLAPRRFARCSLLVALVAFLGTLAAPAVAGNERVVTAPYSALDVGGAGLTEVTQGGESTVLLEVLDELGHVVIGSVKVDGQVGDGTSVQFCGKTRIAVRPGQTISFVTPYGYFGTPPAGCPQGTIGELRMTFS